MRAAAFPVLAVALSACSPKGEPRIVAAADLSPAQKDQAQRAADARDFLFRSLLAELSAALERGGPAAAIPVCRDRAPAIAKEVSAKAGLAIGRTSFKLRNPGNTCPPWAEELVEKRVSEPSHVILSGGSLGVLFPIVTAAPCIQCHGEEAKIAPAVREALAASYPADRATEFREGDLRGWFWIEVPAAEGR